MSDEKILMAEAATLYYEKNCTQQEIAGKLSLSRQTVSKLLNDAIRENIVEIKIHNPVKDCAALESEICSKFNIDAAVVCSTSGKGEDVRRMMTVKAAADYIVPLLEKGGQKIAVSWGRTIQSLIGELPEMDTQNNIVFPLFGATDSERSYFLSNELARSMADKIGAAIKYAWFPYLPDNTTDCDLLKNTSYYKKLKSLWDEIDLAVVGIGNTDILELFGKTFGYSEHKDEAIGDIATHFFSQDGKVLNLYKNTLCASFDNLKGAKQTVAVACGEDKTDAIRGALKTGLVNTLITDEHTAKQILGK